MNVQNVEKRKTARDFCKQMVGKDNDRLKRCKVWLTLIITMRGFKLAQAKYKKLQYYKAIMQSIFVIMRFYRIRLLSLGRTLE